MRNREINVLPTMKFKKPKPKKEEKNENDNPNNNKNDDKKLIKLNFK